MKHLMPIVVVALCAACSPKTSTDAPAKEAPATDAPKAAAPEAPKAAELEKPAAPPAPTPLVVRARSFGGVDEKTKPEQAALEAALPGYTIKRFETEAEGDTYVNFGVELDGKMLAVIGEGHRGVSVRVVDGSIKDEKGVGLGSTHAALMKGWPDAKCRLFTLDQPTDGIDPFKSVDCKMPSAQALWFRIDVTDMPGVGEGLPPAEALAERPITSFHADYPPLGGWR